MQPSDAPIVRLPSAPTLFRNRAERFRQLAESHQAMAGYLALMAELADIQQILVDHLGATALPEAACDGKAPLDVATLPRNPLWRQLLEDIATRLDRQEGPIGAALDRIRHAADSEQESWADALLTGDFNGIDAGLAPFVAAALQVYWTLMATHLAETQVHPQQPADLCPVCGSHPVASLLQSGGAVQGLRYLCCSLCAAQWHHPRIQCVHCGSNAQIAYYGVEGADDAVKAEACGACNTYLKIMDREKDMKVDPFADDIATLGLDLLMAEEGYQRLAVNPYLLPGG